MRLCSDDENDPGFGPWQDTQRDGKIAKVFLDGVEVVQLTMADEEKGEVRRGVLDADGYLQVDPNIEDEIWVETVTGKVEIVLVDRG
jgi:hypothetical protein